LNIIVAVRVLYSDHIGVLNH